MPELVLYGFEGSNAVRTATLLLEHKGLPYTPVRVLPGLHVISLRLRGFRGRTVPAMRIDGRRVQGTRAISLALDAASPGRPLHPRPEVAEVERWGEQWADACRRVFYCAARRDPQAFEGLVVAHWSGVRRTALRAASKAIVRGASQVHAASDEAGRRDLEALPAMLDRIDGWIADGTLSAEHPTAADFQIAPSARALLLLDDLRPLVEHRPLSAWARALVPHYAGHVRAVLPGEWLVPLRPGVPSPR